MKAYERYSYGTIDFRGAFGADMTHWPSAWRDLPHMVRGMIDSWNEVFVSETDSAVFALNARAQMSQRGQLPLRDAYGKDMECMLLERLMELK